MLGLYMQKTWGRVHFTHTPQIESACVSGQGLRLQGHNVHSDACCARNSVEHFNCDRPQPSWAVACGPQRAEACQVTVVPKEVRHDRGVLGRSGSAPAD
eukprot:6482614-Amphidinium_carterae.1